MDQGGGQQEVRGQSQGGDVAAQLLVVQVQAVPDGQTQHTMDSPYDRRAKGWKLDIRWLQAGLVTL